MAERTEAEVLEDRATAERNAYRESQRMARRRVEVRAILHQINDLDVDTRLRSVLHGLLNLVDDDYGKQP